MRQAEQAKQARKRAKTSLEKLPVALRKCIENKVSCVKQIGKTGKREVAMKVVACRPAGQCGRLCRGGAVKRCARAKKMCATGCSGRRKLGERKPLCQMCPKMLRRCARATRRIRVAGAARCIEVCKKRRVAGCRRARRALRLTRSYQVCFVRCIPCVHYQVSFV